MKKNKFILSLLVTGVVLTAVGCSSNTNTKTETPKTETVVTNEEKSEESTSSETTEQDETITSDELKEGVKDDEKEKIKKEIEEKFKEQGENVVVHDVYSPKIEVDKNYDTIFANYPDEVRSELQQSAENLTGLKAENFKFAKIDGQEQDLSSYYGKPFIMELMSTTCKGCMELAPIITELKETYPDIPVLQVVTDDEGMLRDAQEKSEHLNHAVLPKDDTFRTKYPYDFVPTLLFINEDGYIVEVRIGSINLSEIVGIFNTNFERQ